MLPFDANQLIQAACGLEPAGTNRVCALMYRTTNKKPACGHLQLALRALHKYGYSLTTEGRQA